MTPSHIMVVDEAGNPPIRPSGVPNEYVTCALVIPLPLRDKAIEMLPRDRGPLKSRR